MQNKKCLTERESVEKVLSIYGMQFIPFENSKLDVLFSFFFSPRFLSLNIRCVCLLNKPTYSIIIRIDPGEET